MTIHTNPSSGQAARQVLAPVMVPRRTGPPHRPGRTGRLTTASHHPLSSN
ncbi:MAG TPA: hypothetical protein VGI74_01200 [Streptosporangiaceae bacterium]